MSEVYQPGQRKLTEDQFLRMINGIRLNYLEEQVLRRSCGLPYDEGVLLNIPILGTVIVTVFQKIRGNPCRP
jgi:hypothetical protein